MELRAQHRQDRSMYRRLHRLALCVSAGLGVMLVLGGCLSPVRQPPSPLAPPAAAVEPPKVGLESFMTILDLEEIPAGTAAKFAVELTNAEGRAVPNKVLLVSVDGIQVRRMRTDDEGMATIYLGRELGVGSHHVRIESVATEAYRSAAVETELTIRPARLHLSTVPPLAGVTFVLDGQQFVTDAEGKVTIEAHVPGVYDLAMLPVEPEPGNPMRASFARWHDNVYTPVREVEMQGERELFVGLSLSYPIRIRFVDRDGNPVDNSRITSVTLKSSHGTRYTISGDGAPHWRTANRIARLRNGLEATEVQFGVESVIVDGANVVNQNQQRFTVDGEATWTIQLLLYMAHVQARDALFGFPVGTGINVHYPDGSVRFLAFQNGRELVLKNLARGLYKVQVAGVSGMAPETPISVSRDQQVELKVLSTLDMVVAVAAGATLALGLLLYGRPQIVTTPVRTLRRRVRGGRQRRRSGKEWEPAASAATAWEEPIWWLSTGPFAPPSRVPPEHKTPD